MVGQREAFGASDKAFYSQEIDYYTPEKQKGVSRHISVVEANIDAVWPFLQDLQRAKGGSIDVLELGAGTCTASLLLRKRAQIGRHVCVDISEHRMATLIAKTAAVIGVPTHGIELVEADFTYELPLPDRAFDLVLFDGALHHSRSIWTTLEQCRRVLRPGGCIAALREAALGRLSYGYVLQRLARSPEAKAGVAENAYLKEQYDYYFKVTGFDPKFVGVYPDWKWKLFAPLNGLVVSKWAIWAPQRQD
jgi:ubiquinone/menaquinone biosynthesis C-methylase UbiE